MPTRAICLFLLLFASFLVANDQSTLPKLVINAKYVLVTTYFGTPPNARIPPDDRQAVDDVEAAIRKWGRYTLVYERKDADLMIVVRKGRVAGIQTGVGVQIGSEQHPAVGPKTNADLGDSRDTLAVFRAAEGFDSAPIWQARETDGLKTPVIPLLAKFRKRVEATAKLP